MSRANIQSAIGFIALSLGTSALALAQRSASSQPLAEIDGQAIYEEDLMPSIGPQIVEMHNQEFDLKMSALSHLVQEKLVAEEAKKRGMTVDVLWDQLVDQKVQPPTNAEVEAFYLAQQDRIKRPLEDVRLQLEQNLLQAKRQLARQSFVEQLRKSSNVKIYLSRPRVKVAQDASRVRGNAAAAVTIVEFGDFQCPYCRAVQPVLEQLLQKYAGRVSISFRDLPLRGIHPQAQQAAEAARCVGDQGKFWEFHDALYASQAKLSAADLLDQAHAVGVDAGQFQECLNSGKFRAQIQKDVDAAALAGVNATPTFFINGIQFSGAQPLSAFESVIEPELARVDTNAR